MGWNDPDMYYQPEAFDLEILGQLNDPQASYSFDDFVVWQHKDGRIFYGSDSGCSCPSPFEDFTSLDKADEATTIEKFEAAVIGYFNSVSYSNDWNDTEMSSDFQSLRADAVELIRKVEKILDGSMERDSMT